jgi:nitroreductase
MLNTIAARRSIRKYKPIPVPQSLIEEVLNAGLLAPSSKNRQPWHFTVVTGQAKEEMLKTMENGLLREEKTPLLPGCRQYLGGARHTLEVMRQAPVTIFITNTLGLNLSSPLTEEDRIYEICNAQSIGAAIQNMTLAAADLGLGSLWICDIFFAYEELERWLNTKGTLFAALTLGYPDESPSARPRKALSELIDWKM